LALAFAFENKRFTVSTTFFTDFSSASKAWWARWFLDSQYHQKNKKHTLLDYRYFMDETFRFYFAIMMDFHNNKIVPMLALIQPGCIESWYDVLLLDEVLDCSGLLLVERLRRGLKISHQSFLEVFTPGRRMKRPSDLMIR